MLQVDDGGGGRGREREGRRPSDVRSPSSSSRPPSSATSSSRPRCSRARGAARARGCGDDPAAARCWRRHPAVRESSGTTSRARAGLARVPASRGRAPGAAVRAGLPAPPLLALGGAGVAGAAPPSASGFADSPAAITYTRASPRTTRPATRSSGFWRWPDRRDGEAPPVSWRLATRTSAPPTAGSASAGCRRASSRWRPARSGAPSAGPTTRARGLGRRAVVVVGGREDLPLADAIVAAAPGRA